MLDLNSNLLYREVIMEHFKNPLNSGLKDSLPVFSSKNPTCGDSVFLQFEFQGDKIINVYQKSIGCSISVSSSSILTNLIKGKTKQEAINTIENFLRMLNGQEYNTETDFGDGVVFQNIKDYPARSKCATTVWTLALKTLKGDE